jgi:hypothetical protein
LSLKYGYRRLRMVVLVLTQILVVANGIFVGSVEMALDKRSVSIKP